MHHMMPLQSNGGSIAYEPLASHARKISSVPAPAKWVNVLTNVEMVSDESGSGPEHSNVFCCGGCLLQRLQ